MTHTTGPRRRPTRPGAPIVLRRLDFGEVSNTEEQELLYSLEESGNELRIAEAKLRTAVTDAAREREQLLAVLARAVAGVMYGADDALGEAMDVLENHGVFVPEFGADLAVAA